jgi:hypothetical protein
MVKKSDKTYEERLKIPILGNQNTKFYTKSGLPIANGYIRIVIGKRGPYIEFDENQLISENIIIPTKEQYRLYSDKVYYVEWRTIDECNVKIYFQLKKVDYADYVEGLYYISPFDLKTDKLENLIDKLK